MALCKFLVVATCSPRFAQILPMAGLAMAGNPQVTLFLRIASDFSNEYKVIIIFMV